MKNCELYNKISDFFFVRNKMKNIMTILKHAFPIFIYIVSIYLFFYLKKKVNTWIETNFKDSQFVKQANVKKIINNVISIFFICIVSLFLLDAYKLNITGIVTGLGVSGVVIAYIFQEFLSGIILGTSFLMHKPFNIGDFIIIDKKLSGKVINSNVFYTTIERNKRQYHIPNKNMFTYNILKLKND